MRNEFDNLAIAERPVGMVPAAVIAEHSSHTAPHTGALSISRAEILASKGISRAPASFKSNLDVVLNSIATVPGYTTPVVSLSNAVQDETDIPVVNERIITMRSRGLVSYGLRTGVRKGETHRPATELFPASVQGGLLH